MDRFWLLMVAIVDISVKNSLDILVTVNPFLLCLFFDLWNELSTVAGLISSVVFNLLYVMNT